MAPPLCSHNSPLDLHDPCVRAAWATLLPAALVGLFVLVSIPHPQFLDKVYNALSTPFKRYITIDEAEAICSATLDEKPSTEETPKRATVGPIPLWRTVVLSAVSLFQSLAWFVYGSYVLIDDFRGAWPAVLPFLVAFTWSYAAVRPMFAPKPTPPYDLFSLFVAELVGSVLVTGGLIYDLHLGYETRPSGIVIAAHAINFLSVITVLLVVLATPIAIPSARVKREDVGNSVSPEDYTTLWGWISFGWVTPLVVRGTHTTLNEDDVWALSPTMQSRAVFARFSAEKRKTLLRRIWAANSLDIILDFSLTIVSVTFNYASPFFLKRILDAIGPNATPETRANAYVYAALSMLCTILKAEADVQHLWFGRRAASRTRSELMAIIYDKALKRKDFSGIVDKDKDKKVEAGKEDDPKAGADVGKIVNLMGGDAGRVSMILSGIYFIYGAPIEIVIASIFLYQLLGLSAFAGFVVLLLGWPLNSFIMRRSIRIQKGVSAARDKRMGVLNELIGAVKFIKFFAWEDRWIERALEAREHELKWMVKARLNSIMFGVLWTLSPILVSLLSFTTYVALGHKLDVATAFTAITLFNMIRQPLNVIPAWIVQILQTGVALNRISTYLDEEEVSAQVSSLKARAERTASTSEGLGLEHASFKWNEVEKSDEKKDKGKGKDKRQDDKGKNSRAVSPASTSASGSTTVGSATPTGELLDQQDHQFELKDLSVRFPDGVLSLVTGPTASGKTALLLALLGEMTQTEGRLIMSKNASRIDEHGFMHAISYAAQSPWLRHQSIRDNILFGYPYDEERYSQVIECCALQTDLDILEDGDQTEIGARGVSLSGGQKARVALARAVYARTKYVLLDDPLSAVDSHTARLLFDRLLRGPLLANRTVILVTHHVELVLPGANYLVRMLDGRIDTQGPISELRARGVLDDITHADSVEAHKQEEQSATNAEAAAEEGDAAVAVAEAKDAVKTAPGKKPRKLVADEKRETGGVKWHIYKTYLKASSYWTWAILFVFILCGQALGVIEKFWIRIWGQAYGDVHTTFHGFSSFATSEHEFTLQPHLSVLHLDTSYVQRYRAATSIFGYELPDANEHPMFYIGVYAAIGLSTAAISILSSATQYTGALRASRVLFKKLLVAVVRATMRWHDVTPQGRMLNRFSKDIETVDSSLASSLQAVNSSLATFFASILTVAFIFPWFLVPATLIGIVYYQLALGYLNTGRDLRRMESNARSPIFSGFGELLEGIVTVRAFSAEQHFLDGLHSKIDLMTKMWYSFWMTNRWLLLRFDVLGAIAVYVTTIFALSGAVDAGLAGICITSAMAFTMGVYWACRFWTALELDLNSVERVVEYLDLPQEPPTVIENSRPPAYWPSSSNKDALIRVENLTIKYAPNLPAVLHDVSFSLGGRERVGLLGRTGSGKSTLAMSVLRFVDPADGRILIDGIDISKIGIHDLRSRLTFIPQDATLFSGTLRENLDPFKEHTDEDCLDVLRRVHMITDSAHPSQRTSRQTSRAPSVHEGTEQETQPPSPTAASTSSSTVAEGNQKTTVSLSTKVSPGGTNFSQGQRQLIAMARALLRRSSIIVLDEATSSIDFKTDAKIQATIREEFGDSLLLTVAHRLRTVIDYDRLIVLDKGTIAEFDTPYNLIQKEDSIFRNMCLKSGTFSELEAAAKAKAEGSA